MFVAAIDFGTTYSGYSFVIKKDVIDDPESVYCPQWYGDGGVLCPLKFQLPYYWMKRRNLLTLDIRWRSNMQRLPKKIFIQNNTTSVDLRWCFMTKFVRRCILRRLQLRIYYFFYSAYKTSFLLVLYPLKVASKEKNIILLHVYYGVNFIAETSAWEINPEIFERKRPGDWFEYSWYFFLTLKHLVDVFIYLVRLSKNT